MMIPEYLKSIVKLGEDEQLLLHVNGNMQFEVYYSGVIESIDDTLYINPNFNEDGICTEVACISIKEKGSDEMHVVFDGAIHGYDNMFCDEHIADCKRLRPLELEGFKELSGAITLGHGIDYDSEKEDYEVDGDDMIEVYNRKNKISWKQVQEEGYDWITIQLTNENDHSIFVDIELA